MKRIYLILILCGISLPGYAQLAKWLLPPVYDDIEVKVDNKVIATDSAGVTSLWDFDGNRLFRTPHDIWDFKEGHALVAKKNSNNLVGIVDEKGKLITVPDLEVIFNKTFNDDYITCMIDGEYGFISTNGKISVAKFATRAWPVHKGFAPVMGYVQPDKKKGLFYTYCSLDGDAISIAANGKTFSATDVMFLSGINKNGLGIAVIKNKLYWFNAETKTFEPMMYSDGLTDKKYHLTLFGDYSLYFENLPQTDVKINAKIGKKGKAYFTFDDELVPDSIVFNGVAQTIQEEPEPVAQYESSLSKIEENNQFGLSYNRSRFLPLQFEEIGLMYGKSAFVKTHNKWGILRIYDDLKLGMKINKGDDIPFRHQKFETQIRLDLPPVISAKDARLEIPASSGCIVDKTSREHKDTESGNFVQYNCVLNIPPSLPDKITTIEYPVTVSYDGIKLFEQLMPVRAWHYKYYNVDPIDSETTVTQGVASFTVNINAEKLVGENDYPFEIKIEADSINTTYEKISETRYKCTVSNLKEGENNLNIYIIEKGCPPSVFPFEITYVKPVPKTKTQESVVVRKKSPVESKKEEDLRLEL